MSNDILKQFKAIKSYEGRINPDRSWVVENKERLMSQIGNTVESTKKGFDLDVLWQGLQIFVPGRVVYNVVRPLAVFLLIITIAASGWITTVGATQNSLPGDFSYGMKVAVNKMTKDNIQVATGIAKDVKVVATKKAKDTPKNVAVGVEYLKKSLDDAKQEVKKAAEDKPEATVEKTKQMTEAVKGINQDLTDAKKQVSEISSEVAGVDEVVAGVEEVKVLASDSALEVVGDVVKKKVDGTLEASDEDIKDMVSNQIEIALGNSNDLTEDVAGVVEIVSSTLPTALVVSASSTTITLVDGKSVTSTVETLPVPDIKTVINETTKKMTETSEVVKKDLAEAKVMVENNQLLEALEKVKTATQTNTEVKQDVVQVKQVVKDAITAVPTIIVDNVVPVVEGTGVNNTTTSQTLTDSSTKPVITTGVVVEKIGQ